MTTNMHTPGPWKIYTPKGDTLGLRAILGPDDGTICRDSFMGDANARLIAAAPELLEALEELFSAKSDQYGQPIPAWAWKKASAAIAKARGLQ